MQIMCLNGWGGKLHDRLIPYLAGVQPDILCLQEVVHTPNSTKPWLTYRDGDHILPQRANCFQEVCAALPDHTATFCPAAQGQLWDGNSPIPSQWGLATFVHNALPIIGQTQGFVHKGFEPDGYGDHPRSRSAHAIRVYDRASSRAVTITHMHGLRDLAGKMDTPERASQARRLFDLHQRTAQPDDIQIICGDFNVLQTSATLSFLKDQGFVELVTAGNHAGTRTSHYTKPEKFADYMLINDIAALRSFDVVRTPEVSDHCPLLLEI